MINSSSVFLLLLIIYYFFAILGMEFFQGRVYEGCCRSVNDIISHTLSSKFHFVHFLYSNASYDVGDYYTGALNETTVAVYYLNSFDNLLRSFSVWKGGNYCIYRREGTNEQGLTCSIGEPQNILGTAKSVQISEISQIKKWHLVSHLLRFPHFQGLGPLSCIYLSPLSRYPLYSNGSQQLVHYNGKNGLMVALHSP